MEYRDNELEEIYEYLTDHGIVSSETINIVTDINGYNLETFNDIIYASTGLRNLEQLKNEF